MDLPTNGIGPEHVVISDFNGDGKLDIAVSSYNSTPISVFLNKGDGTFNGPIVTSVAPSDVGTGAMVVGDFNEDGIRDLVVGPILLLGNGDGTFRQGPALPNSLGTYTSQIKAADLNGDGHLDLVQVGVVGLMGNGFVAVSLGNGDGTFRPTNVFPIGSIPGSYSAVTVTDFNGDKKLDILACDYGVTFNIAIFSQPSTLLFYAGNGDGTFQAPLLTTTSNYAAVLVNADFNGDGIQDLLIAFIPASIGTPSSDGKDGIVLGNGNGTFQEALGTLISLPSAEAGDAVQAADLDLDGKADVLTANRTTGVLSLILNGAIGQVPPAAGVYEFTIAPGLNDIATGDLNGDGLPDIVVVGSNPTTQHISVFLSQKQ